MISRIWRGWTTPENADEYQELLLGTILPGIRARSAADYLGARVYRREVTGDTREVEFVTTMLFQSLEAVIAFAGPNYTVAVVPPTARRLLLRFDHESTHYDVVGTA
jgi:hypothetical protein